MGMQLFNIPKNYSELQTEEIKALADNYEANNILESTYFEIQGTLKEFLTEINDDVEDIYF